MTQFIGHGRVEVVERTLRDFSEFKELNKIDVRRQLAHEIIGIAFGFFSPLKGFMTFNEVDSVVNDMRLPNGILWPIPLVFDVNETNGIKEGDVIGITYMGKPLAIMHVKEIFTYDKAYMAEKVYKTRDIKHPGVKRTLNYANKFIGGDIWLIKEPKFSHPYTDFWLTPRQHREVFERKGWKNIVAFQTRNVPHTGHEYLMKYAWFAANGSEKVEEPKTGILVNVVIGEKRIGDYIDEAILLTHDALSKYGYISRRIHMLSFTLWDMRYAGPREAVLHAIIRSNIGCTHHVFGRDHAGVGNYYSPYEAHKIFDMIDEKDLIIKPIFLRENYYCPKCGSIENEMLCDHKDERQEFSGSLLRSVILDEVKPTKMVMRPEVFDILMKAAKEYGFGSPFVTEEYLEKRRKIFDLGDY
ncbi:sulfate adenylyltransferase [Sulfurisphaera tokodaii]|uniref:sulfate adenylyltransferase n=2 Tax=Sulfurisphaera tokodaii TaxID=111955 RepID=F9VPI0_SULTO|nr:sulfate adenylyltransferase [Sulfurisphaera tokodaii]BAK54827.1 sulfate adenylyltransferase [Sulfurisphaera tokodaii str. 7]HII73769.1 sulfate adenylyltransferase [Sulfurisphaera tokodaii]